MKKSYSDLFARKFIRRHGKSIQFAYKRLKTNICRRDVNPTMYFYTLYIIYILCDNGLPRRYLKCYVLNRVPRKCKDDGELSELALLTVKNIDKNFLAGFPAISRERRYGSPGNVDKMDYGLYKLYLETTRLIYSDLINVGVKADAINNSIA